MTRSRRRQVEEGFERVFGRQPEVLVRAPGRVNLLGAHVDYNEGWVLPGAIDRCFWVAADHGAGSQARVHSLEMQETAVVSLSPVASPPALAGRRRDHWSEYPTAIAWALTQSGYQIGPVDVLMGSELPMGAGVSSSAALEVALLLAWCELSELELPRLELAGLGRKAENEFLDVPSGIMDQFASLHGRCQHVLLLDCRTLEWEALALPTGLSVLVADSGVRRRLVDGGITDRRGECHQAVAALRELDPDIEALRDVSSELLEGAVQRLPETLYRRARHVVEECARVKRGAKLLRMDGGAAASARELGSLMHESHRSSRDLYEVSIPELDSLVELACNAEGCYGARLAGAGFGGCVTVAVESVRAAEVASVLQRGFLRRFGRKPEVFHCRIDDGAELVAGGESATGPSTFSVKRTRDSV